MNNPIVTIKNETAITTSRDVAEYFGKNHRDVIRKIDHLLPDLPNPHAYFCAGVYTLPETGCQPHPYFEMTRDGFVLIAMGFTGKKALQFKLAYIAQFNAMEEHLKKPAPVIDHAVIARLDRMEQLLLDAPTC